MSDFSSAASTYDSDFTQTAIGKVQREQVWAYLNLVVQPSASIWEWNAGTGEDALWFATRGNSIRVSDVSEPMLEKAKEKLNDFPPSQVQVEQFDLSRPDREGPVRTFDVIFSNFAGLNCLSPDQLKALLGSAEQWLKPNGQLIMVFLGRFCAWETGYFLLKGESKKAWRRRSKESVSAKVGTGEVPTWYYSPEQISQMTEAFEVLGTRPIGTFVPPSYLNPWFENKGMALSVLDKLDRLTSGIEKLSEIADHYLIHLRKK